MSDEILGQTAWKLDTLPGVDAAALDDYQIEFRLC